MTMTMVAPEVTTPPVVLRPTVPAPVTHVLTVLGGENERIPFDVTDSATVDAARGRFDYFHGRGYLAYTVTPTADGVEQEVTHAFVPSADTIMMPPLVGG